MLDEREFIARFNAAGPEELARLLVRPTAEEERILQAYLGIENYLRMRSFALRPPPAKRRGFGGAPPEPKGNVVVLHGIMGSELSSYDPMAVATSVWLDFWRLIRGGFGWLRLDEGGLKEADPLYDVRASGILKRYYGQLLLALWRNWNVRGFWFDWRKDTRANAAALEAQLMGWFGEKAPVHLVAHSQGGLVARAFIRAYPDRWASMADPNNLSRGGRLIMLGTPNYGSFAITQVLTGANDSLSKVALLDLSHSANDLTAIAQTFPGVYQMLPSPAKIAGMEPLYQAETYGARNGVSQRHLDAAREFQQWLGSPSPVDLPRMIYIAGYNQNTACTIPNLARQLADPLASKHTSAIYGFTPDGDGTVPHVLGLIEGVDQYFVEEEHGNLPRHPKVIQALDDLLTKGKTNVLPTEMPELRGTAAPADPAQAPPSLQTAANRATVRAHGGNQRGGEWRGAADVSAATETTGPDERAAEELIARAFLGLTSDEPTRVPGGGGGVVPVGELVALEVGVCIGNLEDVSDEPFRASAAPAGENSTGSSSESGAAVSSSALPPDALAVGHYIGVRPQFAELALDQAISKVLFDPGDKSKGTPEPAELLITQYVDRGTLRGELGQPFFLSDPRQPSRLIVLAGMGQPGHFGKPELTVLVRELAWALGQLGKRHLATVLIGTGGKSVPVDEGIEAWLRGMDQALGGNLPGLEAGRGLLRLTFVEKPRLTSSNTLDLSRVEKIEELLRTAEANGGRFGNLRIKYRETITLPGATDAPAPPSAPRMPIASAAAGASGDVATRVLVQWDGNNYRFGALTQSAAIPERLLDLDSSLISEVNDKLAAQSDATAQAEYGLLFEQLMIPDDLRNEFHSAAPLVLLLDSTSARLHWEMLAQRESSSPSPLSAGVPRMAKSKADESFEEDRFLATGRSVTRQLRTTYAPPPEPPPPPRRTLRVLVVADPAEDMPLPGAQREGMEVADLFKRFNEIYAGVNGNRIEVTRLLGPHEASRVEVVKLLTLQPWDVLHFAGHCLYDAANPTASGWIFTDGKRVTARELYRIDRVPKFVFSNACESGITPDRAERRDVRLAPSFAEAFFGRGVANFVCTAWPVDDEPAREFACRLYAALLGLEMRPDELNAAPGSNHRSPEPMYRAMREARTAIASGEGIRTWGAYQHYGNPYFRLFDAKSLHLTPEKTIAGVSSGPDR